MVDTYEVWVIHSSILESNFFIYANTISLPVAIGNKQTKLTSNAAKTQKAQSKTL